jgi:uncharacterized protein (UPF0333 family)
MKLPILLVAGIVLAAIVLTYYVAKHYNLSRLSANTGVPKEQLVAATVA